MGQLAITDLTFQTEHLYYNTAFFFPHEISTCNLKEDNLECNEMMDVHITIGYKGYFFTIT